MIEHRILLVEDDEDIARLVIRFLDAEGISVVHAKNGIEALEKFSKTPFSIVITDLHMPEMDGEELIEELQKTGFDPVIIMQTVEHDLDRVISMMKKGIFDYLPKPIRRDELIVRVLKAIQHYDLVRMKKAVQLEREVRLKDQINWFNWKEQMAHRDRDRTDKNLFSNLRTSFAQGTGFGSLLSLVALIPEMAEKKGDDYIINAELMSLIQKNAQQGKQAIDMFFELDNLLNKELELSSFAIKDMIDMLKEVIGSLQDKAAIKEQKITLGQTRVDETKKIMLNKEYFLQIIREIFINAFKYSEEKTTVFVLYKIYTNKFILSVLNVPSKNIGDVIGIPPEYEQLIFEPFFRTTKVVDDRYDTLDFGLGLTEVEKIIKKHSGNIRVYNIMDYLSGGMKPELRVNVEIELPLCEN